MSAPVAHLYQARPGAALRAAADTRVRIIETLSPGILFHGRCVLGLPADGEYRWVKRLSSEGGGYVPLADVKEL